MITVSSSYRDGPDILDALEQSPAPISARVTDRELVVSLCDGRRIATPLVWYPVLLAASAEQRANIELSPFGLHWPDLDEDLSVDGMLRGQSATDEPSPPLQLFIKLADPDPAQRESFARGNAAADNDNADVPFWERAGHAHF